MFNLSNITNEIEENISCQLTASKIVQESSDTKYYTEKELILLYAPIEWTYINI